MTDNYTPEPWRVIEKKTVFPGGQQEYCVCSSDGKKILAYCMREDDASRIVACVNACKGLTTEYLESVSAGFLCEMVDSIDVPEFGEKEIG